MAKKESVTITTQPPKRLDPVKVIDTNKGGIVVKYPAAGGVGEVIRIDTPRSSGRGSSNNNISLETANVIAQQSPQFQSQVSQDYSRSLAKQQSAANAEMIARDTNYNPEDTEATEFTTSSQGRVFIGNKSYVGNAIVPGTGGLTANEFNRNIKNQGVASGQLDPRNYGRVSFSGSFANATLAPDEFLPSSRVPTVAEQEAAFFGTTESDNSNALKISKSKKLFVISRDSAFRSVGVPFGTPEEQASSRGRLASIYGINPNEDIFTQVKFSTSIQNFKLGGALGGGFPETEGVFRSNQESINYVQGAYANNQYLNTQNLTEEEFNTQFDLALPGLAAQAKIDAKNSFNMAPNAIRQRAISGDIVTGIAKTGVGLLTLPLDVTALVSEPLIYGLSEISGGNYAPSKTGSTYLSTQFIGTSGSVSAFLGNIQTLPVAAPGITAEFLSLGALTVLGAGESLNAFKAARGRGASRLAAFDSAIGKTVAIGSEDISKVKIRTRPTNVQINFDDPQNPFKTLRTGQILSNRGTTDLLTSQASSQTLSKTTVTYESFEPKFFAPSIRREKSFSFLTGQQTSLLPENLVGVAGTGDRTFASVARGTRNVDIRTSNIIRLSKYDLGTTPKVIRQTEKFSGFGRGIVSEPNEFGLVTGIGKSETYFKPTKTTTFVKGFGKTPDSFTTVNTNLKGRPRIVRSDDYFFETAKITDPAGTKIFGKSRSSTLTQGRKGKLGFVTNTYIPEKVPFTFDMTKGSSLGSGTIGRGSPKTNRNPFVTESGSTQITSQPTPQMFSQTTSATTNAALTPINVRSGLSNVQLGKTTNQFSTYAVASKTLSSQSVIPRTVTSQYSALVPATSTVTKTNQITGFQTITAQRTSQASSLTAVTPNQLVSISPTPSTPSPFFARPFAPRGFGFGFNTPQLSGFDLPTRKRKRRKSSYNIAPGFSATILDISSPNTLNVSRNVGVLPNQIRTLQKTKKGKPGRKPYFKFTDL